MARPNMFSKKISRPDKPEKEPPKTVLVTVQFEMDEQTSKLFLQSSIERVINTSVKIIEAVENGATKEDVALGDSYINLQDWDEWKPVVVATWNAIHDAVFRERGGLAPNDRAFTLRKGD